MSAMPSDSCRLQRLPITDSHVESIGTLSDSQFPVRPNPMRFVGLDAKGMPQQSCVVFTLPYEEQIAFHILLEHKQRFWLSTHLNAPALTDGEEMGAIVLPDADAIVWVPMGRQ